MTPAALIPILSAANFVIGMGAFVVVGLVTPIGTDMGIGPAQAGTVLTSYALAYAVLSPLIVSLTGQIGRRRVMAAGLTVFGLAAIASSLAPSLGWLQAARVLAAAGAGVVTPVAAAVVAGLVPTERRARALASVFFGLTLSQVVGVPAGSYLAYEFGWRVAFAVVAALALPCAAFIWWKVPAGLTFQPVSLADLRAELSNLRHMLAVAFTASFLGSIYVVFTFLAPLLETRMAFTGRGVSLTLVIFGLGAVVGNLLGGRAADRVGPYRTLFWLTVAQVACLPVFSLLPLPGWVWWSFVFLWSVLGWSFAAGQQARLISLAPERAGVLLALNAASIYIGAAVGSAIGGLVATAAGLDALGWIAGLGAVLTLGALVWSERLIRPAVA